MNRNAVFLLTSVLLAALLFVLNVCTGSIHIPLSEVWHALWGGGEVKDSWRYIVVESRLPQAVTALLSGASLAVSGLLLQTAFRNPLADPSIFGINSGAGLGVALVMLLLGRSMGIGGLNVSGFAAVLTAAFIGAMAVMGAVFFFSHIVRNNVMLLIIGIMIGFLASSAISLLTFFASDEGVKSYMVWGMGNFGGVPTKHLPMFSAINIVALLVAVSLAKPLNALLLGEQYAENLGINTRRLRHLLIVITGILTAITTAFCGPVAFIGLAVPHIARLCLTTDNHRRLLPATIVCGSIVALLCNYICHLPGENGILPLNAVTPLIGAPIIIYVITRHRG